MDSEITIKLPNLLELAEDGKKIIFSASSEEALVKFLEHEAKVIEMKEKLKQWIEQSALSYSKNFSSVTSDKVSVLYRAYGKAFGLQPELEPEAEAELVDAGILKQEVETTPMEIRGIVPEEGKKEDGESFSVYINGYNTCRKEVLQNIEKLLSSENTTTSWKIDSKALEAYVKEKGAVPAGIEALPRVKQISISLKKAKTDE